MEVVGVVSGVITLVETTSKLTKSLVDLVQRWQNAPGEITALLATTENLATRFAFVQSTIASSHDALLDDIVRHGLIRLIVDAEQAIAELESLQKRLECCDPLIRKANWAFKDSQIARSIHSKIESAETGLSKWLDFIYLKGLSLTLERFDETQQIMSLEFTEMKLMLSTPRVTRVDNEPFPTIARLPTLSSPTTSTVPSAETRRIFHGMSWEAGKTCHSWGLRGRVIKSSRGRFVDYDVGLVLHLPLAWVFGDHALRGELSLRTFPMRQNTLTIRHPSYFTVARVLGRSHPFLQACRANDVTAVRIMLQNGEGRPTDVDRAGNGALLHAIQAGSLEVVTELMNSGTDVDEPITNLQTTPLEYAVEMRNLEVVRTLLRHGASADHVDARGLDVSFCCWFPASTADKRVSGNDIFTIVKESIALDTAATWTGGITAVHAAAVFSGASEIDFLARSGHDIELPDHFGRVALHSAARRGNSATYFALLDHGAKVRCVPNRCESLLRAVIMGRAKKSEDHRGWYIPAYEVIAKDLLKRNANLSDELYIQKGWTKYPACIRGRRVTIPQLAAAHGTELEAWFLRLVQDCDLSGVAGRDMLNGFQKLRNVSKEHVVDETSRPASMLGTGSKQLYNNTLSASGDGSFEPSEHDVFWDASERL